MRTSRILARAAIFVCSIAVCSPVLAQPFEAYLVLTGDPTHGGVAIPHSPALNPTDEFTFEAWVGITNNPAGEDCRSIAGKNYQQSWWVGMCRVGGKRTLRSYLKGGSSVYDAGEIPGGKLTHVAVVFDGSQRRHYINGELAGTRAETGPLPVSGSEMRIGSDVSWERTPTGTIDEVRLWNVARSQSQIRAAINVPVDAPQAGLVGVWALDGNGDDVLGTHDGTVFGGSGFLTNPVALNCLDATTALCVQDERFSVSVEWRTPGPVTGLGTVVTSSGDSGLFWFFNSANWELMVKILNGCGLNDHYWMFSAATTNVFYRLSVNDVRTGTSKIYFNYPGPPAPAITDTSAFATCP